MNSNTLNPTLTVIMCAYNEMNRIQTAFDELMNTLKSRVEHTEVIILDNGSSDGTREWLQGLDQPMVRVELNRENLGKGGSIKKGISLSRGRYIIIHDPDLEYRSQDIWGLFDLARQTNSSLVLGSRVLGGKSRYKYLQNYLGVLALTCIIRILYRCFITDAATAMKLIDGNLARNLRLECHGFDLDFELVTRIARLGGTIREVPIDYFPRSKEEGKKLRAWRDGSRSLLTILLNRLWPRSRFLFKSHCFDESLLENNKLSSDTIKALNDSTDTNDPNKILK